MFLMTVRWYTYLDNTNSKQSQSLASTLGTPARANSKPISLHRNVRLVQTCELPEALPSTAHLGVSSASKSRFDPNTAADCITTGIRRIMPHASWSKHLSSTGVKVSPKLSVASTGGTLHHVQVTGPVGDVIESHFGFLGGDKSKTAVIEMAAARVSALCLGIGATHFTRRPTVWVSSSRPRSTLVPTHLTRLRRLGYLRRRCWNGSGARGTILQFRRQYRAARFWRQSSC